MQQQSTYLPIQVSIHPDIHPSIHPSIQLCIHPSASLSTHLWDLLISPPTRVSHQRKPNAMRHTSHYENLKKMKEPHETTEKHLSANQESIKPITPLLHCSVITPLVFTVSYGAKEDITIKRRDILYKCDSTSRDPNRGSVKTGRARN